LFGYKITLLSAVSKTLLSLHSIRILPHQQDTGGFFVAVLEKVRSLVRDAAATAGDDKAATAAAADSTSEDRVPRRLQRKRRRLHGYKEDPFVFFTEGEPLWPSIRYPCSWQYVLDFKVIFSYVMVLMWWRVRCEIVGPC
jgi:hypothetical protein